MTRNLKGAILWCVLFLLVSTYFLAARLNASNGNSVFLPIVTKPLPYPLWAVTSNSQWGSSISAIIEMDNGDFVVVGVVKNGIIYTPSDGFVARINPNGSLLWQKIYPHVHMINAEMASDGGLIAIARDSGRLGMDGLVLRIGADGNVIWARSFAGKTSMTDVAQFEDGGFLIADQNGWIVKLNPDGAVAWQKQASVHTFFSEIAKSEDGGAIVAGSTVCPARLTGFAMKVNSDGTIKWHKCFTGGNFGSITQAVDSGYIAAGYSEEGNSQWLVKLDKDGQIIWQYSYHNDFIWYIISISQNGDGGYVAAGYVYDGYDNPSGNLLNVDADGKVSWGKRFTIGRFESVIKADPGGYTLAGHLLLNTDFDFFALRVNDEGDIPDCGIIETDEIRASATHSIAIENNRVDTFVDYESNFIHPSVLLGDMEMTRICPDHSSTFSSLNLVDPAC